MIKSCVTIALVPHIKTGPWIFWNDLEASMDRAAAIGFDGIELFTPDADAVDPDRLSSLLDKHRLVLAAVGTGAGKVLHGLTLTDPDAGVRGKAISFINDMIDFGARFKAPAIIGSMQGNIAAGVERPQSLSWLSEGLNVLGKRAGSLGVPLIYEPLNRYESNLINTLGSAAAFLDTLETENVKLLADLFHMNIEEQNLPEAIRESGRYVGHVHFADSNRKPMGGGHTSMPPIVNALNDISYTGFVSAEAFPWPTPDEAASRTIQSFRKYFNEK